MAFSFVTLTTNAQEVLGKGKKAKTEMKGKAAKAAQDAKTEAEEEGKEHSQDLHDTT